MIRVRCFQLGKIVATASCVSLISAPPRWMM